MCSTQNDSWFQTFHSEQFVNKLENSDPIFQNTWVETILAVSISHLKAHCFKQTLKRNTRLWRNMSTNHHLERSTCSVTNNCASLPSKQQELGTQTERWSNTAMYMLISCIQVYSLYYYFKMQKPVNTESKKQGRQKEFYVATFS